MTIIDIIQKRFLCGLYIIIIPDDFFSDEMRITEVQIKHPGNFFKQSHAAILLF